MSRPQTQKNDSRGSVLIGILILILTTVLSFQSIFATPFSIDSFTHFAIGQYVVKTGKIPHHTDLSYKKTDPSLEWISHSWLSDTLLFMVQKPHQNFGVFFLLIPMLILSIYLTALLLLPLTTSSLRFVFLCIPILCSLNFWRFHPFIFIVPLQLLLMLLIHQWHKNPKYMYTIPLIILLWANMSGGTIAIPTFYLVVAILLELIIYIFTRTTKHKPSFVHLFATLATSVLASLINPFGIRIWIYTLTTLAVVRQNASFSSLTGAIDMLNQTYNKQQFSSFYLVLFSLYVIVFLVSFLSIILKKQKPLRSVLYYTPSLIFLPLAFFWIRFLPLAVFTTLPLFAWSIEQITNNASPRLRTIYTYSALICTVVLLSRLLYSPPALATLKTPKDHAMLIRNFSLPANVLTTYDLTGYIMYSLPEYKMMIDAQDDLLNDEYLTSYYQPTGNFTKNFTTISDALHVQTAIVSRQIGGLPSTLSKEDSLWNLLYVDYDAALYVNKTSVSDAFIHTHALQTMRLNTNLGYEPEQSASSAAELEKFISLYPDNTLFLGQLATIYRINSKFSQAEELFKQISPHQWNFSLYTEYGRLNAAQGKCIQAKDYFLKALTFRNEKNYSRTVLDLAVLYAGCLNDKKRAKHYFTRYNSFLITSSEREKLHMLTKQFNIDMNQ